MHPTMGLTHCAQLHTRVEMAAIHASYHGTQTVYRAAYQHEGNTVKDKWERTSQNAIVIKQETLFGFILGKHKIKISLNPSVSPKD